MNNTTENEKIIKLCDSYKAIVGLSMPAISENDLEKVRIAHAALTRIQKKLDSLTKNKNDYLQIIDVYSKFLAIACTKLSSDNLNDKIEIIKMSINLDPNEIIYLIPLAQLFLDNKKFKEAIVLSKQILAAAQIPPPYLILARAYKALKMNDYSIDAYKKYLVLNKNDLEVTQELDNMLKETLGV